MLATASPPELISYAVWLYFRFPLSLRMVEEMLAARGIEVSYETVRRWALKFAQKAARRIRARSIGCGERWISLASCWTSSGAQQTRAVCGPELDAKAPQKVRRHASGSDHRR